MIMPKFWCERCGIALVSRKRKNNVTNFLVEESHGSWEVEMVILSLGWFCDSCRHFILNAAVTQVT